MFGYKLWMKVRTNEVRWHSIGNLQQANKEVKKYTVTNFTKHCYSIKPKDWCWWVFYDFGDNAAFNISN